MLHEKTAWLSIVSIYPFIVLTVLYLKVVVGICWILSQHKEWQQGIHTLGGVTLKYFKIFHIQDLPL